MKAEIFYFKHQEDLLGEISSLLRQYVYADIEVQSRVINDGYPDKHDSTTMSITRSYVDLLMSSMIRVDDFKIFVEDGNGLWWYMGHWGYKSSEYMRYDEGYSLRLPRDLVASVFPAVAIMNRMVLLPQGIYEKFEKSREFSYFPKPLDLQGVVLVDFHDYRAVQHAVRQIGIQIKTEIAKLCNRYMSINKILHPDFDDLAKLLKVDKRYFNQFKGEIFVSLVKLTPRIVSGPVRLAEPSHVELEIQNESVEPVGTVRVQVRAPSGTLTEPVAEYLDFSDGNPQTQRIGFEVLASMTPYCPLEVLFVPDEIGQMYTTFPIPVILDVVTKS